MTFMVSQDRMIISTSTDKYQAYTLSISQEEGASIVSVVMINPDKLRLNGKTKSALLWKD
jgi:hypothetical protein